MVKKEVSHSVNYISSDDPWGFEPEEFRGPAPPTPHVTDDRSAPRLVDLPRVRQGEDEDEGRVPAGHPDHEVRTAELRRHRV